jgi:4-carboxymuconolactone decarboxylase
MLTEFVWGKVWTRKGIDRRTRSFMNIGILMALNRPHELGVNLRMAVNNGLSRAEIGEAILHAAAYCGVPAGVNSIAVARQLFAELDRKKVKPKRGK